LFTFSLLIGLSIGLFLLPLVVLTIYLALRLGEEVLDAVG
jgi:hypothetical protein